MPYRAFIRKAINNIFYRFIYETERHNGTPNPNPNPNPKSNPNPKPLTPTLTPTLTPQP